MKTATIIPDKQQLVIRFTYDPDLVAKVKTLSGRRWEPNSKTWTAPITRSSVKELQDLGFEVSPGIAQWLKDQEPRPATEIKAAHFSRLFPYQQEGVQFIESRRGRALLAHEMGLGKTAMSLVWLDANPALRPVIIICPASLKLNWEREIRMWMGGNPRIAILKGKNGKTLPQADIYIINYDILSGWVEELRKLSPKVVVADEVHYAKSSKAQRTKALKMLCKGVPHVLSLSGTPIVNRPVEMFNALNILSPATFPSFTKFAFRYCGARHNGFGWDFSGATHTEELHSLLTETVMIRRLKADVLKDLPDKLYSAIPMDIDNRKEYNLANEDLATWMRNQGINENRIDSASQAEALVRIEALKQLAAKGKLSQVIEWMEDFLEQGQKLVVFAVHKFIINTLMERFKDVAVKIDGSVSIEDRQKAVDRFQTDDSVRLFVGNVKAAGSGLTLTAASNVAFLEFPWSPSDVQQAEDRCHRIGQKDTVNVYYLIAKDTIDEAICKLIDKKRKVLDQVLEGKSSEESSIFTDLLEQIKKG